MRSRARSLIPALALVSCSLAGAGALPGQPDSTRRGPAVTTGDAWWLGGAGVASAVTIGFDSRLATAALRSPVQRGGVVRSALDVASEMGGPGALALGAALWATGRLTSSRTAELVGLRAAEAILASGAVTTAIKGISGRARPDKAPGDARDFSLGRGIRDHEGFDAYPSGHASTAFALAAAVDAEWKRLNPGRPRWVGPALYGVAALTAASRVFDNRHWTSDVILGSAIGVIGGRAVVRWHADRPMGDGRGVDPR